MSDVKWIKITTDIFDDEKILLLESLPESDSIIVIWFKLLCLAGKTNNSGVFLMSNSIPYTDSMLATIFRRKETTVKMALDTFEQFGMIERVDGVVTIPNWNKHQTLDAYERKKLRDREYQAARRAEQKALVEKSSDSKTIQSSNVGILEEDIDKEEEYILLDSKESNCRTDVRRCVEAWNSLAEYGIKPVSKIRSDSKRGEMLNARIKQYGVDDVLRAIEKIKDSSFLQGKTKTDVRWFDFEWFVRPNNFPKVLEGKYDDKCSDSNESSEQVFIERKRVDELGDDEYQ